MIDVMGVIVVRGVLLWLMPLARVVCAVRVV